MTRLRCLLLPWLLLPLLPLVAFAQRVAPKPIETPTPHYPASLTDTGRDGTATIEFSVGLDGTVQDPVVKSTDDPAFSEAALAVLPGWKFTPGTRDGQTVAMKVSLPFKFSAPPEQKLNATFGRKVFIETPPDVIPASQYQGPLEPLSQPRIRYPRSLSGSGREERVQVEFLVLPDGRTANPMVVSETAPEFAAAAIMYAAGLVFELPVQNGKPVTVQASRSVLIAEPAPAAP
jgi:TonB family protein